jgi:deoxyribonuclease V
LRVERLHSWDMPVNEAIALQRRLAKQVCIRPLPDNIRTVAGVDVGLSPQGRAAVVVVSIPDLETVEVSKAEREITFPYIPGLLSFREAPVITDAVEKLRTEPDVFMFDGHGIAHPRRLGIAAHMGILLNKPSIGCAKSRLVGDYEEPSEEAGSASPLLDNGEIIGMVVRTRERVKPVFVSVGNMADLDSAVRLVMACTAGYRLPEPTRRAHAEASKK